MISFIHIPKTGGSTISKFLLANYSNEFLLKGYSAYHSFRSINVPENITIVSSLRDPLQRFLSTYNYYLYGSEMWSHRNGYKRTENIKEFVSEIFPLILKTNIHVDDIVWRSHFLKQSHFLHPSRYKDTILLMYGPDLYEKVKILSMYLHSELSFPIPKKDLSCRTHNKTLRYKELTPEDSDYVKNFVRRFYSEDYNLFKLIKNKPECFKKII